MSSTLFLDRAQAPFMWTKTRCKTIPQNIFAYKKNEGMRPPLPSRNPFEQNIHEYHAATRFSMHIKEDSICPETIDVIDSIVERQASRISNNIS
jgi:hypothetical protein